VARLRERIHELAAQLPDEQVKIMHICGTHEHAIGCYALRELLPEKIKVIAGPGCPVCVADVNYINTAIRFSLLPDFIVTTYGDMLDVPGSIPLGAAGSVIDEPDKTDKEGDKDVKGDRRMSLLDAKGRGGDVRGVLGVFDAAEIAERNSDKQVVFLAVGFETTLPSTAALLRRGAPANFSIIEAGYYTPAATLMLPDLEGFDIRGFLLPGHASSITGLRIYEHLPRRKIACAAAGFEPVDVLAGIAAVLQQLVENRPRVVNAYTRVIAYDGNKRAQAELCSVFELEPKRWRGIAEIPDSGFRLREEYRRYRAVERFADLLDEVKLPEASTENPKGCCCRAVTLGLLEPPECPVFLKLCTPDNPYGPCMVSEEGTCRAWALYGVGKERIHVAT